MRISSARSACAWALRLVRGALGLLDRHAEADQHRASAADAATTYSR